MMKGQEAGKGRSKREKGDKEGRDAGKERKGAEEGGRDKVEYTRCVGLVPSPPLPPVPARPVTTLLALTSPP